MQVGSDTTNYRAVEAATGRKMDRLRAYTWTGNNHGFILALKAAGYGVDVSYKFRFPNGQVIQSSTIPAAGGHAGAIDADLVLFEKVVAQLGEDDGVGYEHEEDAKTAAQSGSPAQLNAATTYCVARGRQAYGHSGVRVFECWTGYDLIHREPQFRLSGQVADDIMLDLYGVVGTPLLDSYGNDFRYVMQVYPGKGIKLGELNFTPDPAGGMGRAAAMNQIRTDIEKQFPVVKSACLWQGGGGLTLSQPELVALKTGFFAPKTAPTPPPATTTPVDNAKLAQLKTLVAGL